MHLPSQISMLETPTPEFDKITAIEQITLHEKQLEELQSSSSFVQISPIDINLTSDFQSPTDLIMKCYSSLQKMESFWIIYNKVKVNFMEIKAEKSLLEKSNRQLRGMVRGILEALALSKSQPNSSVSTRISSRALSKFSAPSHRIIRL